MLRGTKCPIDPGFSPKASSKAPYPEAQLRDFIATGMVTADTLVWSEGMAGWQKAGEIPGLLSGGASAPPTGNRAAGDELGGGGGTALDRCRPTGVSWRSLVFFIGAVLVVPSPWVLSSIAGGWFPASACPDGPISASPAALAILLVRRIVLSIFLGIYVGLTGSRFSTRSCSRLNSDVLDGGRWFAANLASNGERLGRRFLGLVLGLYRLVPADRCP